MTTYCCAVLARFSKLLVCKCILHMKTPLYGPMPLKPASPHIVLPLNGLHGVTVYFLTA